MKKNYHVVIHYEGAMSYDIEAKTEDEAKEEANTLFENEEPDNAWNNIDWFICDSWEVK